ncbi:DUF1430 domain-containing protein, partial [Staphylococcus microti]
YNVEITKVTYINDYKILINTTDNQLKQEADKDKNLKIFDSELKIKVFPLNKTNLTEEGIYYLKGKEKDARQVNALINQDVGSTDIMDNSIFDDLSLDFFSTSLTVFLIVLLFAVLLHDLLNQKEELKILYDLGYRKSQIVKFIIHRLSKIIWMYIVSSMVLTLLSYIMVYNDGYIHMALLIAVLIEVLLLIMLYIFIVVIVHFFVMRYARNSRSYSKYVLIAMYMMISVIAIVLVTMSTTQIISNYKDYQKQKISLKHWDITKDHYGTLVHHVGQVKSREIDKAVSIKMKTYFLSDENKGFIADMENFLNDGLYVYQYNEKKNADIEPEGKTVIIDENYLRKHPKKTVDNDDVLQYIKKEDKTQNILVPARFKQYKQEIIKNYNENFAGYRDIGNEPFSMDPTLHINIIWVKNDIDYFTYNARIGGAKNTIVAPIAIVETGNIDPLNYSHYFSNAYYFKSYLDNPYETIHEGLKKHKLDGVIQSAYAVYDTKVDIVKELQTEMYKYTGLALLTSITFIITTLTFIQIYFKSYQFQIFLKRSLGYSYWSIHKWMLFFLVMLHVLMGLLLLTSHNIIAISVFASITLIETLSVAFTFMKLNRENVNLVLKGKKDD